MFANVFVYVCVLCNFCNVCICLEFGCVYVCACMFKNVCVCTCVCMLYFFISLLALYTSRSGVISYHLCT